MEIDKRITILLLVALLAGTAAARDGESRSLALGVPVSASLTSGQADRYTVDADGGWFVYLEVDQKAVDVRVIVRGPDGSVVTTVDGPARGPEAVAVDTTSAGTVTVEVSPLEDAEGDYAIELQRLEKIADDPEGRLDQLLAQFSGNDVPGAVVAVIENGRITHRQAVGMADLAWEIPFRADTVSNIGSVSKQFTAFAVLLLADRGKLSLDDDVRDYFPNLPDLGQVVTVRNLLNHTSGYREFLNLLAMTGLRLGLGDYIPRDSVLDILERQPEFQDPPGSRYNYNNSAYTLSALLVEQVSGRPFHEWMHDNVFLPLGMEDTQVRSFTGEIVSGAATGYVYADGAPFREGVDLGGGGGATMGPGGVYTTIDDLAKWMANFASGEVGGTELVSSLMTPTVDIPGGRQYGLGLAVGSERGLRFVEHGGADTAHRAHLLYYPEIRSGVVAMSNHGGFNASETAHRTSAAFFADRFPESGKAAGNVAEEAPAAVDVNLSAYDALLGRYELVNYPGIVFEVSRGDGKLFVAQGGNTPEEIAPLTPTSLRLDPGQTLHFEPGPDGAVQSVIIRSGSDLVAERVEAWNPAPDALPDFAGRYYSDELRTIYTVELEDGELVLRHPRLEDMTLRPKSEDSFTTTGALNEVAFDRNTEGEIIGMRVSNVRTLNVRFDRQH